MIKENVKEAVKNLATKASVEDVSHKVNSVKVLLERMNYNDRIRSFNSAGIACGTSCCCHCLMPMAITSTSAGKGSDRSSACDLGDLYKGRYFAVIAYSCHRDPPEYSKRRPNVALGYAFISKVLARSRRFFASACSLGKGLAGGVVERRFRPSCSSHNPLTRSALGPEMGT